MKYKATTKSSVPDLVGVLGAVGVSLFWGPAGLITFSLFRALTKRRVARDVDYVVKEDVSQIVDNWKKLKAPGESTIRVSKTVPFGGFNIPATREYTFSLEDDE